jgi:Berberine and berberine like
VQFVTKFNLCFFGSRSPFINILILFDFCFLHGLPYSMIFQRWLQGGGLSYTARQYGMGVDHVVSFRVVLANGTIVNADACTNPDLFWALRGGGGGTYGVVTHVHYQLFPVTPIVAWHWNLSLSSVEQLVATGRIDLVQKFVQQWLPYWIQIAPKLDHRWGGYWNSLGGYFVFSGTLDDAKTTFLDQFDIWYNTTLDKTDLEDILGTTSSLSLPSSFAEVYNSWYDYKGGSNGFDNPDSTGANYRLIPQDEVVNNPEKLLQLLYGLTLTRDISPINYFLGGQMQAVGVNDTAVHPAVRKAIFNIGTLSSAGGQKVRDAYPNNITGVCFNHHSANEPDWQNACWGEHFDRLAEIKAKYDPDHRFNCWHCVGYQGNQFQSSTNVDDNRNICPSETMNDIPSPPNVLLFPSATPKAPVPTAATEDFTISDAIKMFHPNQVFLFSNACIWIIGMFFYHLPTW